MDEQTVREQAQRHGEATVAGDMKQAGSDLEKTAYGAAGEVMKKMPSNLESCEISDLTADGDEWVATIVYRGTDASINVESRWAEREGRPKIVDLKTA